MPEIGYNNVRMPQGTYDLAAKLAGKIAEATAEMDLAAGRPVRKIKVPRYDAIKVGLEIAEKVCDGKTLFFTPETLEKLIAERCFAAAMWAAGEALKGTGTDAVMQQDPDGKIHLHIKEMIDGAAGDFADSQTRPEVHLH